MLRNPTVIGYVYQTQKGDTSLPPGEKLPPELVKLPVRMMVAFWLDAPQPWIEVDVGDTLEALKSRVELWRSEDPGKSSVPPDQLVDATFSAVASKLDIDSVPVSAPHTSYTLVADATPDELKALRSGSVIEHVQGFVFQLQPTPKEQDELLNSHQIHLQSNLPAKASEKSQVSIKASQKR